MPRRALLPGLAAALVATAWPGGASSHPYAGYPLALPETLRGSVEVPVAGGRGPPADTLRALYRALASCWQAPEGLRRMEDVQITARFSLRRDGTVIGVPQITFARGVPSGEARDALVRATLDAIARCTPARVTPGLGAAVAGRPMALRFLYRGPQGRGI